MRAREAAAASIVAFPFLFVIVVPFVQRQCAARRAERSPSVLAAAVSEAVPAARRAWPGYDPLDQPVLFAYPGNRSLLIGAARPPEGFSRSFWVPGSALVSRRHLDPPFFFVMSFDLDGSTVTAIRASERSDPADSMRVFIHERFHRFQSEKGGFVEESGAPYLVEEPEDVGLAGAENDGLAAWIEKGDQDGLRDFAAARTRRRRLFPAGAAEGDEERVEGTARFVEWAALEVSTGPAAMRRRIAGALRGQTALLAMGKPRAYSTGAALCRWLDAERVPGWREAVARGRAPSEIAVERLALGPDEVARRVRRLESSPAYAKASKKAAEDIAELDAYRAWSLKEYGALPGRRLVLTSSAAAASFSTERHWTTFRDGSTMMNVNEWVVDRPEIHARLGRGKTVVRRDGEAEFVVPPDSVVTLDGARWTPRPGRYPFRTLSISSAPRVELTAGPGALVDDGKTLRLSFGPGP